jgi:HK97 gp10 family phage protein
MASGGFFTILEAVAKFKAFETNMKYAGEAILVELAVLIRDNAKASLGHYQKGWPSLAESTLRKKNDDTPLFETGVLRDSIGAKVFMHGPEHGRAVVGTDEMSGVYAEQGTRHEPPRPFLLPAALDARKDVAKIAKRYIHAAWTSAGRDNEMLHLLHAIKLLLEVAHEVYKRTIGKGVR